MLLLLVVCCVAIKTGGCVRLRERCPVCWHALSAGTTLYYACSTVRFTFTQTAALSLHWNSTPLDPAQQSRFWKSSGFQILGEWTKCVLSWPDIERAVIKLQNNLSNKNGINFSAVVLRV